MKKITIPIIISVVIVIFLLSGCALNTPTGSTIADITGAVTAEDFVSGVSS